MGRQRVPDRLFNELTDDTPNADYDGAVAILYQALAAEYSGDLRVAAFGITSFFDAVEAVLAERGFPGPVRPCDGRGADRCSSWWPRPM